VGFNLLPNQLGVREPAKLGLENLFKQPIATQVATAELSKRLKRGKSDAPTLYLLGRIEMSRGQTGEAIKHYLAATDVDQNYLLAWEGIADKEHGILLPPATVDRVLYALLRLEPDRYFGAFEIRANLDPKVVWDAFYAAPRHSPPTPGPLWRLEASARAVATAGPNVTNPYRGQEDLFQDGSNPRLSAARGVAQMPLIGRVLDWLDNPGMSDECNAGGGQGV
jgi:hypothetical protein